MSSYNVLGLMSGTSLDGVDIVLCSFKKEKDKIIYEISASDTLGYDTEMAIKLRSAHTYTSEYLFELHHAYGAYLGKLVNQFISKNGLTKKEIDLVSSHGHTIFHQPDKGFTFQLGHGASIAKACQLNVVSDFRTQDVVLGGQGAPLVPIGDQLLFSEYEYCLNIGGIANISFEQNGKRIAWDICPANMVLNFYASKKGRPYDAYGEIAALGDINDRLLNKLNGLDFYNRKPPKTLGREWVYEVVIPLLDAENLSIEDILATFVEHIAIKISQTEGFNKNKRLLITGGGAYNNYLVERINKNSQVTVTIPDETTIEYKEALIFALLGYLKVNDQINILSSATGASKNHSSGVLFLC